MINEAAYESAAATTEVQPVHQLGLAILAVLSFKIFLAVQLGLDGFVGLTRNLAAGNFCEQFVAKFMMLDGISLRITEWLVTLVG